MKTVNLYLFRHGETDWNKQRLLQGSTDIPLNDTGREQAQGLRDKLSDIDLEIVLSSDLSRAKETAEIVFAGRDLPIEFYSDLQECHLGDVEGVHRSVIDEKYGPDFWEAWKSVDEKYLDTSYPNGETPRQHLARLLTCLNNFVENNDHTKIAVSTHGGAVWRLIHHCEKHPDLPQTIENCGLYHLQIIDGQWKYVGHLL